MRVASKRAQRQAIHYQPSKVFSGCASSQRVLWSSTTSRYSFPASMASLATTLVLAHQVWIFSLLLAVSLWFTLHMGDEMVSYLSCDDGFCAFCRSTG